MTTPNLFAIEEVDSVDHLHDDSAHDHSEGGPGDLPPRQLMSLDAIKAEKGLVYVPKYVPEAFVFHESEVIADHAIGISYRADGLELSILQDSNGAKPRVKRGYVQSTSVNGQPAHLIRGGWVRVVKNGSVSPEWDPNVALSLIFQIGDRWFLVEVDTDPLENGFDESELLRVAESLSPS